MWDGMDREVIKGVIGGDFGDGFWVVGMDKRRGGVEVGGVLGEGRDVWVIEGKRGGKVGKVECVE